MEEKTMIGSAGFSAIDDGTGVYMLMWIDRNNEIHVEYSDVDPESVTPIDVLYSIDEDDTNKLSNQTSFMWHMMVP